ncbi:YbjN domain-containing protein [Algivirga pacifica]|uniref:Molecular chaperone Tir n=1 Tax=Algivirga pacifica TaxID=1162670 RepID=A0ABP9D1F2_9BACT
MEYLEKVRNYLIDLGYDITKEDPEEELFIINNEDNGLLNVIIDCEFPILIIEAFLMDLPSGDQDVYKKLLIKNREIVHGAFVLNEEGNKLLFRDTLQLENLDQNELEGSLNSLALLLTEYYSELLAFSK